MNAVSLSLYSPVAQPASRATDVKEVATAAPQEANPASVYIPSDSSSVVSLTYAFGPSSAGGAGQADVVSEPSELALESSGNILNFIEAQLQRDVAAGATPEELQSRLEAGLEGFQKGYQDALELLGGLESLPFSVSQDLGHTQSLVEQGIEDLKAAFIPSANPTGEAQDSVAQATDTAAASAEKVSPASPAVSSETAVESTSLASLQSDASQYSKRFSFELTTQDGDTVHILAAGNSSDSVSNYLSMLEEGNFENSLGSEAGGAYALQVNGDLDDEEMAAIADLLSQVDELSSSFYDGDITAAFQKALEMGYDSREISGYSLRLSQDWEQPEPQTVIDQPDVALEAADSQQSLASWEGQQYKALADFIDQVLSAYDQAAEFQKPKSLLLNLVAQRTEGGDQMLMSAVSWSLGEPVDAKL